MKLLPQGGAVHFVAVVSLLLCRECAGHQQSRKYDMTDEHGGIPMGKPNKECDNGKDGIEIDWDPNNGEAEHTCDVTALRFQTERDELKKISPSPKFLDDESYKRPFHYCLDTRIKYKGIPLSGPHRPLWPKYGTYLYLPPQRWVHSLEHGAVVLLYHPCVTEDDLDLRRLKQTLRSCLRKHIITPSKLLTPAYPFGLIAFQHGILLNHYNEATVTKFIRVRAQKGPETAMFYDGQYDQGLMQGATIVSDYKETSICPQAPR